MNNRFKNFGVVILAAGQGKRLGCTDMPKVMMPLGVRLKPMLNHVLDMLEGGGISRKNICLVIGFQEEKVRKAFNMMYNFAVQNEQLGTAHAAKTGVQHLPADLENFMVLNGDDSAFYKFETLNKLADFHVRNNNDLTLLTCEVPDPKLLGRVVRNASGKMTAVVEKENITPEVKSVKEVSTGTFCFKREWFNNMYSEIKPIPGLNEYGLPSFIELAVKNKAKNDAMKLENSDEWFGINTPEQLEEANRRMNLRQSLIIGN